MMQDYWNDPPEYPEPPDCPYCEDGYAWDEAPNAPAGKIGWVCAACGKIWYEDIPNDYSDDDVAMMMEEPIPDEKPPQQEKCPHGNEWGECSHCDYLSDIAYDAALETSR